MGRTGRLMAGLLAAASPAGLRAQEGAGPAPPAQPAPTQPPSGSQPAAPATPPAPPRIEFRGADGKPLPPDVQRQLEEEFRKNPLPVAPPSAPSDAGSGDVVVTGQRPRGAVIGDIPAERTFSPLEIRAFGVGDIEELIGALGPQVSSNGGREEGGPVTLLNGRRVSDFSEIARIPSEAIERLDVFPEELALKYGYRADQKVVNVVTFARYRSRTGQFSAIRPTEGERDTVGVSADLFTIRGDARFSLGADYTRSGSLLESDRGVLAPLGAPDMGRFRTLLPQTERLALDGLVSGNLVGDVSSTLNGRFEASGSESLLGLGGDGPLRRDLDSRTVHLGTTHNGRAGPWLWSLTGNYDRASAAILTDVGGAGDTRDEARSVSALANADLVLSGPVLELPTGPLSTSVRGGVERRDFESASVRGGVEQRAELSRDRGAIQVNIDLPIARRGAARGFSLGDLSANANLEIERLSDFGTLRTFGYGLHWSPVDSVALVASVTSEEGAPTVEQLGGPMVATPNVRTFDFTRREVVDVTRVFGGNAGLRADDRQVVRIGLDAKPLARTDLTVSIDYVSTRIDDPIAPFPIITPQIEAAFPDRFARDGDGRLLRIDGRPLNFFRSDQEELRWGVDFTRPLGPVPPGMQDARTRVFASEADVRRAFPGARIVTAEPGSPLARRAENMASRLILSLYHTWRLEDSIIVREGIPALDLLDGGAVDFRGGRRRHEIEFQAGAFKRGLGARVTANWQSGTDFEGQSGTGGGLRFSPFTTVNVNLFANLADRFGGASAPRWLKGTRATIGVANLFNSRPEVGDETGFTPLSYQPAYLDPLGRLVSFSLRKVF